MTKNIFIARSGMPRKNLKALYSCLIALTLTHPLWGDPVQVNSPKEALTLKRITEYWRDGDYLNARRQILDFLEKHPQTQLRDSLSAMLGDLYLQEGDYRQALATYDLIGSVEVREKTFFNHLQAHFEMKDYPTVIEKAENFLKLSRDEDRQLQLKVRYILAEAAFREAMRYSQMEERLPYLKIAKPQFKILTQTQYGDRALFPLAEIHRLLKEEDKAISLYLLLAQKYPVHRERFLFQAAISQIGVDKSQAIKTFGQIHQMQGKRAGLAAFNELILLYQTQKYQEYISLFRNVAEQMPSEKLHLLQFYEGKSLYCIGEHESAVEALESFVESCQERSKELKAALLLLVNCSQKLKDSALLDRTMYTFKKTFPHDKELAKIILTHGQLCRETGNFSGALQDFKTLLSDFPNYEESEIVLYDMGLLLEQTEQLQEAQETFLAFVETYPDSSRQGAAWRHLINCSIEQLKNRAIVFSSKSKESFVMILETALKKKNLLSEKEAKQYRLVQVKLLCDLNKYEEAISLLEQCLADNLEEDYLAEAHLLMAIAKEKTDGGTAIFISHAEKALSLRPHLPDSDILHLQLYNAYLTLASSEQEETLRQRLVGRAADHLFSSEGWKKGTLKQDNLFWLTHHYYELAKQDSSYFEPSSTLFHSILKTKEGMSQLVIPPDSMELEEVALKFAHLLGLYERTQEQITLLEALVHRQETSPEFNWKLRRRSVLDLAKAYEEGGQYENALRSYQFLSSGSNLSSAVTATAELHLARLQYQLLPLEKKRGDHPDVIGILHRLKDLQIQKRLQAEPIHLEAALEYAELRTSLSDPEEQTAIHLFFLERMQEDFTSQGDPVAAEYSAMRDKIPEKELIFLSYMQYVEAEILRRRAEIRRQEGDHEFASQCEEEALVLLNDLLETESLLKPYLLTRVKHSYSQLVAR